MRLLSSQGPRRAARVLPVGLMLAGWLVPCAGAVAQHPAEEGKASFADIARAERDLHFEARQVRRVRDGSGGWVGVREVLEHRPPRNSAHEDSFQLTFVGVEGQQVPYQVEERKRRQYERAAGFIHLHQGFHVRDAERASSNYLLVDLDERLRAGRTVDRVLVYPRHFDRSIWILEIDRQTGYPLYRAEFDTGFRMVGELIVDKFKLLGTLPPGQMESGWGWQPSMQVESFSSAGEALASMGSEGTGMTVPPTSALPAGFQPHLVRVVRSYFNNLSGQLVVGYSDGIDELFVIQGQRVDPFGSLASSTSGSNRPAHTIARSQDLNLQRYAFHHGGVLVQVHGRGALHGLDGAVKQFYQAFVSSSG